MNILPLLSLCKECTDCLSHLYAMAERGQASALSDVSECHRRASSALADLHAELFRAFMTPLPRADMGRLGEAFHDVTGAVFAAAQIAQRALTSLASRKEELQGLCRMGDLLSGAAATLPRFVKGKQPPAPDTYRFYAEQNKVRGAHTIDVLHAERSLADRALDEALAEVARRLNDAYGALLSLMLQSV